MLVGAWLLEEAIKKLMGFEATLFEEIELRKCKSKDEIYLKLI